MVAVAVGVLETCGDGHRLEPVEEDEEVEVEVEEEEDMKREVTSRALERRVARALSGSEGNRGGLVGF